ncbi:MAG: aldo/keto reductase [Acidobacteriaceae bacterium]|nr:aldo/keto reductase [Acidobacteriaceae bacterium]MBV9498380.1 aldo/keto reductase [Acidobacteriaceae bacterium]
MAERDSRRGFLQKSLIASVGLTSLGAGSPGITAQEHNAARTTAESPILPLSEPAPNSEWRNKQAGMAYRRLGRTGLMISEIVCGGDPIGTDNYKHLDLALEMGLNYLDMAPAYGNGDCEIAYGKFLGGPAKRNKVFLQTKVSAFGRLRNQLYREIFNSLPSEKQQSIMARVEEIRRTNLAEKPGYYLTYFPGQHNQFEGAYLSSAMMPDYAHLVEGSQQFRKCITDSLEASLRRVGTDHFDLLMCPHGANTPDELDNPHIYETFLELKTQGKVRFLGVTSHNDAAGVLRKATELGHYDAVQMAYNVINGGYVDQAILDAAAKNVGMIAMKTAHAVATHHKELQPIPQWRIDKVNKIIPGDMKPPLKGYLWVLQNPWISAVNSNLWDETFVRENLGLAGKKVQLQQV